MAPPSLIHRLGRALAHLLPAAVREFIVGDLEEAHALRTRERGAPAADRRYLRDVVASLFAQRLRRSLPGAAPAAAAQRRHGRRSSPLDPGGRMLEGLATDVRLALRSIRLRPGFSALAIGTIALGVGATTAVFGLTNQVLLRPLPGIADPGGAAYLEMRRTDDPTQPGVITALDFLELREAATTLEGVAAYGLMSRLVSAAADQRPTQVMANWIDGDFFELLGVRPLRGRLLDAEESGHDADPHVAVISEALWSSLLGRAEDVIGRTIQVQGQSVEIVGVAGGGFAGVERSLPIGMWIPAAALGTAPERIQSRQSIGYGSSSGALLIRPRAGVGFEDAERELRAALAGIASRQGEREVLRNLVPTVFPGLHTTPLMREATGRAIRTMAAIAALVLLIACANVANLLLFRGLGRRGDVAVRRAVGASGSRVARQELVGSAVLAGLGGAAGLGVAWLIARLFQGQQILLRTEPLQGITVDVRVLSFVIAAVATVALLAGALPAWLAGRTQLLDSLRESGKREARSLGFLRGAVSAAQLALAIPLLVGALLLTRTVGNLYRVELGLEPEGVFALTWSGPGRQPMERQLALLEAVRAVPGVESVALDYPGPFWSGLLGRARLPAAPDEQVQDVNLFYASPGWFELLGMNAERGRFFAAEDVSPGAPPRALITAPLATRLFGRTDVLGETLMTGFGSPAAVEIVGVVGDVRMGGPRTEPSEAVFLPYPTRPNLSEVNVLVRVRGLAAPELIRAVQQAAASVFPELPLPPEPTPLTARIDGQLGEQRMLARLLRLVAALSLLLAAVGLYGVIAFAVTARKRELGIRLALGSSGRGIALLVLRQAGAIVTSGVVVGLLGAYALSRVLESRLFGVGATDPRGYLLGSLLIAGVAACACVMPVRSALRTDPAVTLREE